LTAYKHLLTLGLQDFWEDYVYRLSTIALLALMAAVLIGVPAIAAPASSPSAPLGVVLAAENAHVGAGVTASGETIYDGDRLETLAHSTLRVRLGSGQLLLRQNSLADVHSFPNGFAADLAAGTVVVASAEGQTFQLTADGATIRPANDQPAAAQIEKVSATELRLTGTRGTLLVSMGDETKTLEAGNSYKLEVQPEDPGPGPYPQQNPHPTARTHFLWIFIPAVAAATAIIVWRATVSPSAP
jgi:hypothetical protein